MNHLSTFEHRKRLTKIKKNKWNWAEKRVSEVFLTQHYDCPQPAGEFRPLTIKHPQYLLAWFTEQHSLSHSLTVEALLQEREDALVDVWVKQPLVTVLCAHTSPVYSFVLFGCAAQPLQKKTACGYIFSFVAQVTQLLSCFGLSSP